MNHPFVQQMLMAQCGLPPGRRAYGFGASPISPSGPIPIHQMNFLRMAPAHMLGGPTGSALGAGRYPYPLRSVPAAAMNMGVAMPMMPNIGVGDGGMMSPVTGCGDGGSARMMDPFDMAMMYGGGGGGLSGGMGSCAGSNPLMMDFLNMTGDDPDDYGAWDGDDDDPNLAVAYMSKARKMESRVRRAGGFGAARGLSPGLGGYMPPQFMYPMGMGMGIC